MPSVHRDFANLSLFVVFFLLSCIITETLLPPTHTKFPDFVLSLKQFVHLSYAMHHFNVASISTDTKADIPFNSNNSVESL